MEVFYALVKRDLTEICTVYQLGAVVKCEYDSRILLYRVKCNNCDPRIFEKNMFEACFTELPRADCNNGVNMSEDNKQSVDVSKFRLDNLSAYAVKAELYIVSLTFSILALSIQFQIETSCKYAAWSEVAGWVLLTISGASGLKMLRNISSEYSYILGKFRYIEKSNQQEKGMSKLSNEQFAERMEEWAGEVRGQSLWLFPIQGYCLVSGLAFLIFARILANPLLW